MTRQGALVLFLATLPLGAQDDRSPYQEAFKAWQQADPTLERDAATGGATIGARADKAAAEAVKYHAARQAYMDSQRVNAEQKATAIDALPVKAEFDAASLNYTTVQIASVGTSMNAIAADPDRAIQRLRLALEQERAALTALNVALTDSQKNLDAMKRDSGAAEQARAKLMGHYKALAADLQQGATQTNAAGTAWAAYYRSLSEAARNGLAHGPTLSSVTAPVRAPAAEAPKPSVPAPGAAPAGSRPTMTLPLYRYTGEWNYPIVGAQFHGPQPESVDMLVREENGFAKGTLIIRFQVPPRGTTESSLRINFEGPFQNTRNQSFPMTGANGAKGNIELLPGSVFNMLEVNYKFEGDQARQGDFLVVKK